MSNDMNGGFCPFCGSTLCPTCGKCPNSDCHLCGCNCASSEVTCPYCHGVPPTPPDNFPHPPREDDQCPCCHNRGTLPAAYSQQRMRELDKRWE